MATFRNPRIVDQSSLITGNPLGNDNYEDRWCERGTIVGVNPNTLTCDVITETQGRLSALPIPNLVQDPQGSGGHIEIPRVGTQVVVQRGIGTPYISQYYPVSTSRIMSRAITPTILGLYNNSVSPNSAAANYLGTLPNGLSPGDWLHLGNQGQFLGLFDQGVVGLYSSAWSHVIATQEGDTLNIAGRNLNIRTGGMNFVSRDYGGKQSHYIQLGTDQMTETGNDNWPVLIRMGGESEGIIDFVITDRRGVTVYKKVISAAGQVREEATGPQDSIFNGDKRDEYRGDYTQVVQGVYTSTISGDKLSEIGGSYTNRISQNFVNQVMNDKTEFINRNLDMSVGRNMNLSVSGAIPALPGSTAAKWMISNGSLAIDVGFPGTDLGSAMSGVKINTYMPQGNITLGSLAGKVMINTTLPDSVLLGATQGVAIFHTVKWELGLQLLLQQLITWLDTHIHPTGMGPSGPPAMPSAGMLNPLLTAIPSQRVLLGM